MSIMFGHKSQTEWAWMSLFVWPHGSNRMDMGVHPFCLAAGAKQNGHVCRFCLATGEKREMESLHFQLN